MDDATKERLRLDALHNEELLHIGKIQKQEREHISQTHAQAREHHKMMLNLQHQAVHDAAITRQEKLNQQEYEHRERILKLERQYALTEVAAEPKEPCPESENAGSRNEAAAEPEQGFPDSGNTESGNGNPEDVASKKGSKAEYFSNMANRAAERGADKRRV